MASETENNSQPAQGNSEPFQSLSAMAQWDCRAGVKKKDPVEQHMILFGTTVAYRAILFAYL